MRKVLVSLLVVAMVLGLVGTAYGYSDVTTVNKYIDKASAFGWIKGYPDGTFKPTGNITRAEAATVVVRALGLEAAADAAKGLGSKFSDVDASHWASGYVNVCTSKGILKGYPDGTFKPEANITNAEIITMVVRALNRESQAVGEWPLGHITVAAAESIIGTGFASSALATRENVATYVAKASGVKYLKLTTNGWEEDATKTFISANDFTKKADQKVTDVDVDNSKLTAGGITYDLVSGYTIAGGTALKNLVGYTVHLYLNDDDDVALVEIASATSVKTGTLKTKGADYFYITETSTKYTLDPAAKYYRNGVETAGGWTDIKVDDTLEFYTENDKVTMVKASYFDKTHQIVTAVRSSGDVASQYITVRGNSVTQTYYMANDTVVQLDGATAKLSDIKENNIVSLQVDGNTARYVNAASKTVAGKVTGRRSLTDVDGTYYYMSLDGVEYRLESYPEVKGVTFVNAATTYAAIHTNDSVTAYLSVRGRAKLVDVTTGTAQYGKLVSTSSGGEYAKLVIDVKGVPTTYEVDKTITVASLGLTVDGYVKIVTDNDGRITTGTSAIATTLTPAAPAAGAVVDDVYPGDKLVKIAGSFYTVGDDTIVYVDGVYGSLASIIDDSRVRYIQKIGEPKLLFVAADTICKIDSSLVAATGALAIEGYEDSVEGAATISIHPTSEDAWADTKILAINEWTGSPAAWAADADSKVVANGDGEFKLQATKKADGVTAFAAGDKVYLRVVDPMGMVGVLSVTLK